MAQYYSKKRGTGRRGSSAIETLPNGTPENGPLAVTVRLMKPRWDIAPPRPRPRRARRSSARCSRSSCLILDWRSRFRSSSSLWRSAASRRTFLGLKRVPAPRDVDDDDGVAAAPGVADGLGAGAVVSWTDGVERTDTASVGVPTSAAPAPWDGGASFSDGSLAGVAVDPPRADEPPLPALPARAPRAPLVPRGGIEYHSFLIFPSSFWQAQGFFPNGVSVVRDVQVETNGGLTISLLLSLCPPIYVLDLCT